MRKMLIMGQRIQLSKKINKSLVPKRYKRENKLRNIDNHINAKNFFFIVRNIIMPVRAITSIA